MNRPKLHEIPLDEGLEYVNKLGSTIATMSEGQWDELLNQIYEQDGVLWELDENEKPIRAFKKQ